MKNSEVILSRPAIEFEGLSSLSIYNSYWLSSYSKKPPDHSYYYSSVATNQIIYHHFQLSHCRLGFNVSLSSYNWCNFDHDRL